MQTKTLVRATTLTYVTMLRIANPPGTPITTNPGWDLDHVTAAMNGNRDNYQVNLTKKIPVLIVYGTATVNEENQIRFFDDVYGYDAELVKALARGSRILDKPLQPAVQDCKSGVRR